MSEFNIIKRALERVGDRIVITIWAEANKQLIEDLTIQVEFWFENDRLSDTFGWKDRPRLEAAD